MKSVLALEDLIKENEERIKLQKRQLAEHESGETKLSRLMLASVETNLDKVVEITEKYKAMLEKLQDEDQDELADKQRIEEAILREKYFKNQSIRVKQDNRRNNDQKLTAVIIIDELPAGVDFEDDDLFEIAVKAIELNVASHEELKDKLGEISKEFQALIRNVNKTSIKDLGMLNYQIPILALQFYTLIDNIRQNLELDKQRYLKKLEERPDKTEIKDPNVFEFGGFPKYHDWWVHELWDSHQAYFALFKWKSIIKNQCRSSEQKRAWSVIFDNWIAIKKMINEKGKLGFEYNYALDKVIELFGEFEEETTHSNLESMESIIKVITQKEDFLTFGTGHNIVTPYLLFKREKDKK